jgi:hypothetical protein
MVLRLGFGDLLYHPPLGQRELPRPPAPCNWIQRAEPVGVDVTITSRTRSSLVKATMAIAAMSMSCADSSTICARRQVTTNPAAPAHDSHQPPALVIINFTHPQASGPLVPSQ